jgi:NhaP-type Na+/H+ or K+/H+ antiporter
VSLDFNSALVLLGGVLIVAAALSGWLRGTVLSISVLAVAAGVGLTLTDVLDVQPGDPGLLEVIELALLVTLFADGLIVERELVRWQWGKPARALILAMPITAGLLALGARVLFPELSWAECLLLGAVLAPTDPVVTSTIVTARRVPALVRHTLNIESGLNDGLALPLVLVLLVFVSPGGDVGSEASKQVLETVVGAAVGLGLALGAGRALDRLPGGHLAERYEGVYALGIALLAYGVAEVTYGNGLIAAFVAGVGLAFAERELPDAFLHFNENIAAVLQVATFVLFGGLIVATGFDGDGLALAAFVVFALLVARPAAVLVAFAGSDLPRPQKLFVAWFGPKGVASMLFALFVLESAAPDRTLVFELASFVILASILSHGLTDTVGARWIDERVQGEG